MTHPIYDDLPEPERARLQRGVNLMGCASSATIVLLLVPVLLGVVAFVVLVLLL